MSPERDENSLPDPLVDELSAIYRADVRSTPQIDRGILNRARAQLAGRRRWLLLRRSGVVAAAVAIVAFATVPVLTDRARLAQLTGDVNGDGILDIRDALALARRVEQNTARPLDDINGDKIVDQRDVDALAMLAVRLDGEPVR